MDRIVSTMKIHDMSMSDCKVTAAQGRLLKISNEPLEEWFIDELERGTTIKDMLSAYSMVSAGSIMGIANNLGESGKLQLASEGLATHICDIVHSQNKKNIKTP